MTGFEPATTWSQTRCANRTALHPYSGHFRFHIFDQGPQLVTIPIRNLGTLSPSDAGDVPETIDDPAVRAGFEPAVQFPVRQFSKLVVSASHPPHLLEPD